MNLDSRLLHQVCLIVLTVTATMSLRNEIAHAQAAAPPSTVVVQADARDTSLEPLARALTRVVSARADALGAIHLAGTPALGLEDLQLALGCIGETTECLSAVVTQLEADALLVPSVERSDETFAVSVLYFDGRDARARRAVRRSPVANGDDAVLAGVEPILRELFELPEAADDGALDLHTSANASTTANTTRGHPEPDDSAVPLVPIVVAGAGVALVATGIVFAVLSVDSQSAFTSATLDTEASVDAALDAHDRASWQAITADVLFAAGAAAIVTGAILFILGESGGEDAPTVAVVPYVGSAGLSLTVTGSLSRR